MNDISHRLTPRDYLTSAARRAEIAAFHLGALRRLYEELHTRSDDVVPIPVQAAFEGALFAGYAALELTGAAVQQALALDVRDDESFHRVINAAIRKSPDAMSFRHLLPLASDNVVADARKLRSEAIHHAYRKRFVGPVLEFVSVQQSAYQGSRELKEYLSNLLDVVGRVIELHPVLSEDLDRLTRLSPSSAV